MFPTQGVLLKCNKSPGQSAILMQRAGDPALLFCRPQGKAGVGPGRGRKGCGIRVGERMAHLVPAPDSAPPRNWASALNWVLEGRGGMRLWGPMVSPSPYSTLPVGLPKPRDCSPTLPTNAAAMCLIQSKPHASLPTAYRTESDPPVHAYRAPGLTGAPTLTGPPTSSPIIL